METYAGGRASEEDQGTEVSRALVAEGTSGIDQSSNTISLDSGTDDGRTPRGSGSCGFLALEELFLGVCGLSTVVGVTEKRSEDCKGCSVVEDGSEGDSRRLHWWKVCRCLVSPLFDSYRSDLSRARAK